MRSFASWVLSLQAVVGLTLLFVIFSCVPLLSPVKKNPVVPTSSFPLSFYHSFPFSLSKNETHITVGTSAPSHPLRDTLSEKNDPIERSVTKREREEEEGWNDSNSIAYPTCQGIIHVVEWPKARYSFDERYAETEKEIAAEQEEDEEDDSSREREGKQKERRTRKGNQKARKISSVWHSSYTASELQSAPPHSTVHYQSSLWWMHRVSTTPWWGWYAFNQPSPAASSDASATVEVDGSSIDVSFPSSRVLLPLHVWYLRLHVFLLEWWRPYSKWIQETTPHFFRFRPTRPSSRNRTTDLAAASSPTPAATEEASLETPFTASVPLPFDHEVIREEEASLMETIPTTPLPDASFISFPSFFPGLVCTAVCITLCGFPLVWRLMVSLAQLLIGARRDRYEAERLQRLWNDEGEEGSTSGQEHQEDEESSVDPSSPVTYHPLSGPTSRATRLTPSGSTITMKRWMSSTPVLSPIRYTAEETVREVHQLALLGTLVFHVCALLPAMALEAMSLYPISYGILLWIHLLFDVLCDERYSRVLEWGTSPLMEAEDTEREKKKKNDDDAEKNCPTDASVVEMSSSGSLEQLLEQLNVDGPPLFQRGNRLFFRRRRRPLTSSHATTITTHTSTRLGRSISWITSSLFFFIFFWLPPALFPKRAMHIVGSMHASMYILRALAAAAWSVFLIPSFMYLLIPFVFWCATVAIQKAYQPVVIYETSSSSSTEGSMVTNRNGLSNTKKAQPSTSNASRSGRTHLHLVGHSVYFDKHLLLSLVSCYAGTVMWIAAVVIGVCCVVNAHDHALRWGEGLSSEQLLHPHLPVAAPSRAEGLRDPSPASFSLFSPTRPSRSYLEAYLDTVELFLGSGPFSGSVATSPASPPALFSLTGAHHLQSPSASAWMTASPNPHALEEDMKKISSITTATTNHTMRSSSSWSTAPVPCVSLSLAMEPLLPNIWLLGEYYSLLPVTSVLGSIFDYLFARKTAIVRRSAKKADYYTTTFPPHSFSNGTGMRTPPTEYHTTTVPSTYTTIPSPTSHEEHTTWDHVIVQHTPSPSPAPSSLSFTRRARSLYQLFSMLTCWSMLLGLILSLISVFAYRARAVPSTFHTAVQQFRIKAAHIHQMREYWKERFLLRPLANYRSRTTLTSGGAHAGAGGTRSSTTSTGTTASLPSSVSLITREEYILKQFMCLTIWLLLALMIVILLASPLALSGWSVHSERERRMHSGWRTAPMMGIVLFLPLLGTLLGLYAMMQLLRWKWRHTITSSLAVQEKERTSVRNAESTLKTKQKDPETEGNSKPHHTTATSSASTETSALQMSLMDAAVQGQPLPCSLWCSPVRLHDRTDGLWYSSIVLAVLLSLAPLLPIVPSVPSLTSDVEGRGVWSGYGWRRGREGVGCLLGMTLLWWSVEWYQRVRASRWCRGWYDAVMSRSFLLEVAPLSVVVMSTLVMWVACRPRIPYDSSSGAGWEHGTRHAPFSTRRASSFASFSFSRFPFSSYHEEPLARLAIAEFVQYYLLPATAIFTMAIVRFSYRLWVLCFEPEEMWLERP